MNEIRIITLLLLAVILLASFFIYNKMKWEKIILKRQMALGTVNIKQHNISYFSLGSLSTLGFICLTIFIRPNIIDSLSPSVEEAIVNDSPVIFKQYKEVPVNTLVEVTVVDYELNNFSQLISSRKISDVVYGTVIGKEVTDKNTYLYVSIVDNTNKLSVIKVFHNNDKLLLDVGSTYIMLLKYSINHDDYYYGL